MGANLYCILAALVVKNACNGKEENESQWFENVVHVMICDVRYSLAEQTCNNNYLALGAPRTKSFL